MPFGINLILFLSSYMHTCSVGASKYRFHLVPPITLTYVQYRGAKILTQLIDPNKSCRQINPKKNNFGSLSFSLCNTMKVGHGLS